MARRTLVVLLVVPTAVAAIAACRPSALEDWRAWRVRVALREELQPVALENCDLKRFGSANDGGYLLCANLSEGIESAYSYGVGPNDDFGCEVSRRYGVPVHEYDCFDPARPTCEGGLLATPDTVFDQIDQMPMELHGVDDERYLELVRRLKQKFWLVNLHFNNDSCTEEASPLPAVAYQTLWVNKSLGVLDESAPVPAPSSELNVPDFPALPECQLWSS